MQHSYIVAAKRTPVAKYGGSLTSIPITEAASIVIRTILSQLPLLKDHLDEVIVGNVLSAGLGQNPCRIVAFQAGIPDSVPAMTVNQVCASGLKSVFLAHQAIAAGTAKLVLAGGMESMSRCPYYLHDHRFGAKFGHQSLEDGLLLDGIYCSLTHQSMGQTAENVAAKYKISRQAQDRFAHQSHTRALEAIKKGYFHQEIVLIEIKTPKQTIIFKQDEQPRSDTSLQALADLKPTFNPSGTVTAGNSSSLNDGAALLMVASETMVTKLNLKPLARIVATAQIGLDPRYMGMGALEATRACLKQAHLDKKTIDLWEINEAFAASVLAVINQLNISPEIVNVNGGAIALGHPIGASGARILTSLIYEMNRRKVNYGLASLCVGGGQGVAMIVQSV